MAQAAATITVSPSNLLYCLGSLCFLGGTLLNMVRP